MKNELLPTIQTHSSFCLPGCHGPHEVIATGIDFEYQTCQNNFVIKQCATTGLQYLDPLPNPEALPIIYPPHYLPYRFDSFPLLIRWARDKVQSGKILVFKKLLSGRAKILDIGCGNGTLLSLIKKFGSPNWELHANDTNQESLDFLSQQGITVHTGDFEKVFWSDNYQNSFDLIILNQVLEHMESPYSKLTNLQRLLKPGGVLFIETPSTEGWDARLFRKRYWGGYHFPRHFYLFNRANLIALLELAGFHIESVSYLASPSFWIQSLHHFFWDKGFKKFSRLFDVRVLPWTIFFTLIDLVTILLQRPTSNIRVVARKNNEKLGEQAP